MKKIISILFILFLTSCSFSNSNSQNTSEKKQEPKENSIVTKSNTITGVINDKPDDIKIENYEDIKKEKLYNDFEIGGGIIANKNTIDNIVSICENLEGKIDYIYNNGKKDKVGSIINIVDLIKDNFKKDELFQELKEFDLLSKGEITGKYKYLTNVEDIKIEKFNNRKELITYLGFYMIFIKDSDIFNKYLIKYLDLLKNTNNINENQVIPVILAYFYNNKKCKTFINNYFIKY